MEDTKKAEEFLEDVLDNDDNKVYNFMINASNQANLTNNNNISPIQVNSIFVVISPYYIEKFDIEGLDLDFKMNEEGIITINDKNFEMVEVKPGVKIFGISKLREGN